jgi:dTDP-4-dehydrorhamnose 3,5-epimerase
MSGRPGDLDLLGFNAVALDDLPGVVLTDLSVLEDGRGSFVETFRRSWLPAEPVVVQANLSRSAAGVIRGLHFHRVQSDYWCLIEGSAFVALADLREGSPTFRQVRTSPFDASASSRGLYVPPGVAHGICAVSAITLQYLVDAYFTGEDEFGVAWDDPDLAVAWPVAEPIVSDRDRANPSLAEVLRDPPAFAG